MVVQSLPDILAYGEWLTHRYDEEADCFQMRHLDRAQHDAATFITDEYLGLDAKPVVIDRKAAMAGIPKTNDLHFILHSAFCASTMLARGFNLPGVSMGLKEPVLLNDIVGWRRRGAAPAAVAERLDHGLHMLARPFKGDAAVVVKPSNVFNALAPLALTMRPNTKAILLYAPLPVFLVSVARKGLWCRLWCRELLEGLITDGIMNLGFEPRDYFRQSDLQVAAVGWLAQQQLFAGMLSKFGPDRIATLDSETLTLKPEATLEAAAKHFDLNVTRDMIAGHPAFSTHSKFGGEFDANDRAAEHKAAADAYGDEIEKVLGWAEAVAEAAGVPLVLPGALL
ncbi:MAG: hypothetical protein ACK4ZE_06155 [Sphingorhabdus sp.]